MSLLKCKEINGQGPQLGTNVRRTPTSPPTPCARNVKIRAKVEG